MGRIPPERSSTDAGNQEGRMRTFLWVSGIVLAVAVCYCLLEVYFFQHRGVEGDFDPCCDFPCLNQGVCMRGQFGDFTCDCTGTGYYGQYCNIAEFGTWFFNWQPGVETVHHLLTSYGWFWDIVNGNNFIQDYISSSLFLAMSSYSDSPPTFESDHHFITADAFFNSSLYARTLPPVPSHCPTAMGTKGPVKLPDIDLLIKKVFTRKHFIEDPHNSNLLFQYYAHHFGRQFDRDHEAGPQLLKGSGVMDLSHIYGHNEHDRQSLRSGINGKLRSQILNNEEFPPYADAEKSTQYKNQTFALPHSSFSVSSGLFVFSTIWLREHNRVCDELLKIHSDWDDTRLFETARIIITGEVIKITLEEYLRQLGQYKLKLSFNPDLIHGSEFQFHDRIHAEFSHLLDWQPFIPDFLRVNKVEYSLSDPFSSLTPIFKESFDAVVHSMIETRAGTVNARNHGHSLYPFLKKALQKSRQLRFQGINAYRKKFGLRPFDSFMDLTGEDEISVILKGMYKDVDAIEYYVGLLVEQPVASLASLTLVNAASLWTVKSVLSSPICSDWYWKPSTFGGSVGWNIVQGASLEGLFCRNMKTPCRNVSFSVPLKI